MPLNAMTYSTTKPVLPRRNRSGRTGLVVEWVMALYGILETDERYVRGKYALLNPANPQYPTNRHEPVGPVERQIRLYGGAKFHGGCVP